MKISLTPKLKTYVAARVNSGEYSNASDVMCDALRLMQEIEKIRRRRLKQLNAELQKGIDDLTASRFIRIANDTALAAFFARL